jgi:hypothetical protein
LAARNGSASHVRYGRQIHNYGTVCMYNKHNVSRRPYGITSPATMVRNECRTIFTQQLSDDPGVVARAQKNL